MALESAQYIAGLVTTNPAGSDDRSTSDDHHRLIKTVLQNTIPLSGAVVATYQELNYVAGVTSAIQTQFGSASAAVASVDARVTSLSADVASKSAVLVAKDASLDARITSASLAFTTKDNSLSAADVSLAAAVSSVDARATSLNAKAVSASAQLVSLNARATSLDAKISSVSAVLNARSTSLDVADTSLAAAVSSVDARVTSASAVNNVRGAFAYARIDISGTILDSYNVSTASFTTPNEYKLVLSSTKLNGNYSVVITPWVQFGNIARIGGPSLVNAATIDYRLFNMDGTAVAANNSVVVYHT